MNNSIDLKALKRFLFKANKPHAAGTSNVHKEEDDSRTITFTEGDWSMDDNFFGGEPFGGRQVIHYKGAPVWLTVYYGRVTSPEYVPEDLYGFLREALQHAPEEMPYRGPATYKKDNLEYHNEVEGDADNYNGKEIILENGKQIYWATYGGGLVDQRAQNSL